MSVTKFIPKSPVFKYNNININEKSNRYKSNKLYKI